jgi:hypothetical protein
MKVLVKLNSAGKYSLYIDDELVCDKYSSESKACEKASKFLKGQNR